MWKMFWVKIRKNLDTLQNPTSHYTFPKHHDKTCQKSWLLYVQYFSTVQNLSWHRSSENIFIIHAKQTSNPNDLNANLYLILGIFWQKNIQCNDARRRVNLIIWKQYGIPRLNYFCSAWVQSYYTPEAESETLPAIDKL